jgi:hypothetical protein
MRCLFHVGTARKCTMDLEIDLPDRILNLLQAKKSGYTTTQIANLCQCPEAYVLVALKKLLDEGPYVNQSNAIWTLVGTL